MSVDVDAVVAGQGDADLELSRQVGGPVDRLDLVAVAAAADELLFARIGVPQPQLVIGRGPRGEVRGS